MKAPDRSPRRVVFLGAAFTAALLALLAALPVSCGLNNSGLPGDPSSSSAHSSGSGQGGNLFTSSMSATSGMGGASSSSSASSGSGGSGGAGGALSVVWQSWDAQTDPLNPTQMFVPDTNNGNPATLILYQSMTLNDLAVNVYLPAFVTTPYPDATHDVENYWTLTLGSASPYVGKSSKARDAAEPSVPQPLGVFDLQLFGADKDRLLVAAFECPFDGNYAVSGISTHRILATPGDNVGLKVFNDTTLVKSEPDAHKDQKWVTDAKIYDLKMLTAKTLIRFAVDCANDCTGDAIEIAWTITAN